MYLVDLKTLMVDAIRMTFDAEFPNPDFRNIWVSLEFPVDKANYPGIWVDFNPIGPLQTVGIGHVEYSGPGIEGTARKVSRWRFQGEVSFTLVALSSLERDRLHDEVVRVMAFGMESSSTSEFRTYIQDNDFVAVNIDFDEIGVRGMSSTMGTPWQTDDVVYEVEITMECMGEFVGDHQTGALVPLSDVVLTAYSDRESDPTTPDGWN